MYKQSPERLLFALSMSTCKQVDQTHIFVGQCLYCTLFMAHDSNTFTFVPHASYSALFELWSLWKNTCGKPARNDRCQTGNVPLWGIEANDAHRMRLLQSKVDKRLRQASHLDNDEFDNKSLLPDSWICRYIQMCMISRYAIFPDGWDLYMNEISWFVIFLDEWNF